MEASNTVEVTDETLPNGYIRLYTGRAINPLDPDMESITIEDIAHALSLNCRFTGHVRWHYSVAQHSILCSYLVEPDLALTALLHDASEAYLSDIAGPVKRQSEFGTAYGDAEKRLEEVIAERFGITFPYPQEIKDADILAVVTESRDLLYGTKGWNYYEDVQPLDDIIIEHWTPDEAEQRFLERYYELTEA